MRIRFWGTRGSLAKPGPTTLRYGGNTSCVEVRTRDVAGNEWDIYAPGGLGQSLEATLAGQMEYTYFPVTLRQFGVTAPSPTRPPASRDRNSVCRGPNESGGRSRLTAGYRLPATGYRQRLHGAFCSRRYAVAASPGSSASRHLELEEPRGVEPE
ncbi:MAG TPA: hypothetical protein VLF14_00075, partial [Candidatus Binatia bacterium]|nr:hypothetical protein [Candidatus Binatia bacterium]